MMETKREFAEKFGRIIEPNEIVFDVDDRTYGFHGINFTAINLYNAGYKFKIYYTEGGKSPHIHVKGIIGIDELNDNQLQRYKKLFLKKYCPAEYLQYLDFQVCGKHRIASENELHYKYGKKKKLLNVWNEDKQNIVDNDLYEEAVKVPQTNYEHGSAVIKGIPITAVAERFELKRKGKLFYCPFHKDTEPSLCLTNEVGLYNCFGCGAGGTTKMFWRKLKDIENG